MILAELADPAPPLMGLDLFDGMMMVGFARQCDGVDGVETSRVTTQLSPSSPGAIPSRIPHLFIPQTCRANAFLTGKILFPLPSHTSSQSIWKARKRALSLNPRTWLKQNLCSFLSSENCLQAPCVQVYTQSPRCGTRCASKPMFGCMIRWFKPTFYLKSQPLRQWTQ